MVIKLAPLSAMYGPGPTRVKMGELSRLPGRFVSDGCRFQCDANKTKESVGKTKISSHDTQPFVEINNYFL